MMIKSQHLLVFLNFVLCMGLTSFCLCVCVCESSSCLAARVKHFYLICYTSQQHLFLSLADHQRKFGEDYGSCQAGISNFLTKVSNSQTVLNVSTSRLNVIHHCYMMFLKSAICSFLVPPCAVETQKSISPFQKRRTKLPSQLLVSKMKTPNFHFKATNVTEIMILVIFRDTVCHMYDINIIEL